MWFYNTVEETGHQLDNHGKHIVWLLKSKPFKFHRVPLGSPLWGVIPIRAARVASSDAEWV